jgi:quercetin dioxygenase-like cupin family protein
LGHLDHLREVQRSTFAAVGDLVAAAESVGDDRRVRRRVADGGQQRRRRSPRPHPGALSGNQGWRVRRWRSVSRGILGRSNVNRWDLSALELAPRLPEILSSTDAARAIVLDLAAGESLADHEVHERAWLIVIDGAVEVATSAGERARGGTGLLVELGPGERHEVLAIARSRLLLLLTPWPGKGHPGGMTIREKLYARRRAAKRALE